MSLSEDQILRYSRQILLSAVGGTGQEKLLAQGATLTGEGCAQSVAAAYLAGGGTPLETRERPVSGEEVGFLLGAADVGKSLRSTTSAALLDANPDARAEVGERGVVGELPASFSGPAPWVALGWSKKNGAVVYRSKNGCQACFEATAGGLTNGPSSARSVMLGALGALAFQRLVLGLSEDLGGVWLDESGALTPMTLTRCEAHR
ncbi:MAG: ThiF family adenylyltransferase [Myxococcota bacterium]